jgi:hypothetical protein
MFKELDDEVLFRDYRRDELLREGESCGTDARIAS